MSFFQVIQLQDGEGPKQTVAVVANDGTLSQNTVTLSEDLINAQTITGDPSKSTHTSSSPLSDFKLLNFFSSFSDLVTEDEEIINSLRSKKNIVKIERKGTEKDMENCFGFDDDEDIDMDKAENVSAKGNIKLVEMTN